MECRRCASHMLPSTGCPRCDRISDDVLHRIARDTLAKRTSLRAKGFVLVGIAFLIALSVVALSLAANVKLFLLGAAACVPVGAAGARAFEAAKLGNNINADVVARYERERVRHLEASAGAGDLPVGVPALRIDRD